MLTYIHIYVSISIGPFVHLSAVELLLIEKWQSLTVAAFLQPADDHLRYVGLLVQGLLVERPPNVRLQSKCQTDGLPCPSRFALPLGFACGSAKREGQG